MRAEKQWPGEASVPGTASTAKSFPASNNEPQSATSAEDLHGISFTMMDDLIACMRDFLIFLIYSLI